MELLRRRRAVIDAAALLPWGAVIARYLRT
jgi:hypothetical protein